MFQVSPTFADEINDKDIKMFQFAQYKVKNISFVFLKYFVTIDQFDGKYEDLLKMLQEGK